MSPGRTGLVLLSAYLVGSIPAAHLLARSAGVDLRAHGSGNLGATNAWRTLGAAAGVTVLVIDVCKGVAAVLLARAWGAGADLAGGAAVAAVMGHVYPPWLRFRGGKGVATSLGASLVLVPLASLVGLLAFAGVVAATRLVSAGSLAGAAAAVAAAWSLDAAPAGARLGILGCAGLVLVAHRANVERLLRGTEPRIGAADARPTASPGRPPRRNRPDGL